MVNMQREHRDAEQRRLARGRVEKRGGVSTAAVGDGERTRASLRGAGVSAPWCR
jgi:hypothetical protein